MAEDKVLEKIKSEIGDDFAAVRPVSKAWIRALILLPAWLVLFAFVLLAFGLREDDTIPGLYLWTATVVQLVAAYILVLLGFRDLIPGEGSSAIGVFFWVTGSFAMHLGISFCFFQLNPVVPAQEWRAALVCLGFILGLSTLPLLILRVVAVQGIVHRAVELGFLFGLGGALCAESAWRLHCPYTSLGHILASHSAGLILVAMLAWAFVLFVRTRDLNDFLSRRSP